jgi:trehalose-phosphatase
MGRRLDFRRKPVRPGRARRRSVLEEFFETVARAPRRALLLDYDGTLAPFRGSRELARPYPGLPKILRRLVGSGSTRVCVVSGRAASDLAARLGWLEKLPELWGSHGLERLAPGGAYVASPAAPGAHALLDEIESWARGKGWAAVFERKPFGFALHRRPSPGRFAAARRALRERFEDRARSEGLVATPFDGGVELRPREGGKGDVVRSLLEEEGPRAAVAYLGDDATDEDAFAALKGRGLSLLVRPKRRASGADVWLRPPGELRDFLLRWERASGGGAGARSCARSAR